MTPKDCNSFSMYFARRFESVCSMKDKSSPRIALITLCFLAVFILITDIVLLKYPSMMDIVCFPRESIVTVDNNPRLSPLERKRPATLSGSVSNNGFLDQTYEKVFFSLTGDSSTGVLHSQGACTDGVYIWSGSDNPHCIRRTHIMTGETFSRSFTDEEWLCGHINDMTYNPNTHKIYAIGYVPGDHSTSGNIIVIDPDSLLQEEVIQLTRNNELCPVHGIAYDRLHCCYLVATSDSNGCDYAIYDEDFQYSKIITTTRYEDFVLQGIETDGKYIYRSLSAADGSQWFSIYDLNGVFVKMILLPVPYMVNELEASMYDWSGNWYANVASHSTNMGGYSHYRIGFQSGVDYQSVDQFNDLLKALLVCT